MASSNELLMDEGAVCLQMYYLAQIRTWVQKEAKLYGRADDEFLIMFLRGCEFDLELTKKTIYTYYDWRRANPQWWDNRNVMEENVMNLLQLKILTVMIDQDPHQPTVAISKYSRCGPNLNNFDCYCKLGTILFDVIGRRENCQLNGLVWIIDCRNYKFWLATQCFKPYFVSAFVNYFMKGLPFRFKSIIIMDAPIIIKSLCNVILAFWPQSWKKMYHLCSHKSLNAHVPVELLPEEYGGLAGPVAHHDDSFVREVVAYNEYLLDDNKYGFQL